MRNFMGTHNLIAVSAAAKETAINTEQTAGVTLLAALGDVINLDRRRQPNNDEATGYEEPDLIYNLGSKTEGKLTFPRAQPQHFAFLCGYGLGAIATAAAGSGYEHTITPISGDLDADRSNPGFTALQRYGSTVLKRRFASCFVNALNAKFTKDEWCQIDADIVGTGKVTTNMIEESITANDNVTSLTLAANAVQGSTAAARLENVQRIRANYGGGWTEVTYTVVSSATPAIITIASVGGAGASITYKVLYIPAEAAWCTFPARVTETPLRVAQMTVKVGGAWSGSAFVAGRTLKAEIKNIEWNFSNNGACEFVPGGGDAYASRYIREGRTQTLKLDREMREYILQQYLDDNEEFGVYILCEGAIYDSPHKYQVEIIFPACGLVASPIRVDGKRLAEAGDLQVLEDATYGSVIVIVKNLQAAYMA